MDSNCVEVAFAHVVRVRDSKNAVGPELRFSVEAWQGFVDRGHVSTHTGLS